MSRKSLGICIIVNQISFIPSVVTAISLIPAPTFSSADSVAMCSFPSPDMRFTAVSPNIFPLSSLRIVSVISGRYWFSSIRIIVVFSFSILKFSLPNLFVIM